MQNQPYQLAAGLLLSLTSISAHATLTANGQGGVYSSLGDLTWTADTNLLGTMEANPATSTTIIADIIAANNGVIHDTPNPLDNYTGVYQLSAADFGEGGVVTWFGAQAFVGYLNSIHYGNSSQWALPEIGPNPVFGTDQSVSQLGNLYYNELGGTAFQMNENGEVVGGGMPDNPYFSNVPELDFFWSATEYSAAEFVNNSPRLPKFAWYFGTYDGQRTAVDKRFLFYAWAASPGQVAEVAAVPVPGALWLFGTGLVGLLGVKRRGYAG